ncbi:MAG TPA: adenylate/guanylate cyclase domain-containing protein, partial [Geminicoccus sp.]|uniref:adenylate/guanylate cyclase domain-containing protein n=1 Tax=Geminicoccus sp. TaxID=2024832 RepID=UPI002B7C3307
VGYSRLMEQDEDRTLARLKAHRQEFVEPLIAEYQGRVVKLMGDGLLAEFASVVDAVRCAVLIQKGMAEREVELPPAERIRLRIGINLGDVIHESDGDIYGDGVNVAARLEQLAEPGGIIVSGTTYDHLQGKLDLPLEFAGEQRVKNIERLVRAYRVRLDGKAIRFSRHRVRQLGRWTVVAALALLLLGAAVAGASWWRTGPAAPPPLPVVAVLPFAAPAGADPHLAELGEGLADGIVEQLSVARFWSVLGRGTSFAYRDRPNPARALGQEQGATLVVEGNLQSSTERLRASVELIDAGTGQQLWSERFDRPPGDWAALRDELGSRIGFAVYSAGIFPTITDRASGRPLDELGANDLALLAREQLETFTKESTAKGIELARLALTRDPRSSSALYILGRLYREQVEQGYAPEAEAAASWGETVSTLVRLEPNYPWAYVELAAWESYSGKRDDLVLADLDRVVELAPNHPQLLAHVAERLPFHGQPERARELLDRAARFDPDMRFNWRQFQINFFLHRFREVVDQIEDFTDPGRWDYLFATLGYAQLGEPEKMAVWRQRFVESWPDYSFERSVSPTGDFSPAAAKERALWLDSFAKAGLPKCATPKQIESLKIKPLPECEAERARQAESRT